jgi:hypothetical protein
MLSVSLFTHSLSCSSDTSTFSNTLLRHFILNVTLTYANILHIHFMDDMDFIFVNKDIVRILKLIFVVAYSVILFMKYF